MSQLNNMVDDAVSELRAYLRSQVRDGKLSSDQADDVASSVKKLNLPGLVSFLGAGAIDPKVTDATKQEGFDLDGMKDEAIEAAIQKGAERLNVPIPPKETRQEAIRLLRTGQFLGDIEEATAVILHTVPDLPVALAKDAKSLPRLPRKLLRAIEQDLIGSPHVIAGVVKDLRENGELDNKPDVMSRTVRVLFGQAAPNRIAETLNTLLANPTVRCAVIMYAASQGVQIRDEDIDAVRAALDPNDPDLGVLVVPAFERLVNERGLPQAMALLKKMADTA